MKDFLDAYTLDDACDDVAKLDLKNNLEHQVVFCQAVIGYARNVLRSSYGIDMLTLCDRSSWLNFCQSLMRKHPDVDNDMAFIMVSSAVRAEVCEMCFGERNRQQQ